MQRVWNGGWLLWATLPLLLSCAHGASGLPSNPLLPPVLDADPVPMVCQVDDLAEQCVIVTKRDWEALVIAVKAACLQTGGSKAQCQIAAPAGN